MLWNEPLTGESYFHSAHSKGLRAIYFLMNELWAESESWDGPRGELDLVIEPISSIAGGEGDHANLFRRLSCLLCDG
jgi:hypothetical protein